MDYRNWINKAISKTGSIDFGAEFVLKDLFDGIEWNEPTSGSKQQLGRQFKNEVIEGLVPDIKWIGKANNNSAKYRKEK